MKRLAALFFLCLLLAASALPAAAQVNPFGRRGFQLTDSDVALLSGAVRELLAGGGEVGKTAEWSNPESGNKGSIKLVGAFEHQGLPCRRLQQVVKLKKQSDPYSFVTDRCRIPSGEWKAL